MTLRQLHLVFLIFSLYLCTSAFADTKILPSSKHHQFMTYGFLIEDGDASLVLRNGGRALGAVGASLAVLEANPWDMQTQLVFFGSANAAFRFNDRLDTLLTETTDAHVGLNLETAVTENLRVLLGWTHQSGHISDNVDDLSLVGPNLGNEIIQLRLIHDIKEMFRVGGSLRPIIGSEPKMKFFGANQFAEWFPLGTHTDPRKYAPFISLGFEEYGVERIHLTTHIQLGVSIGSHFSSQYNTERVPVVRLALGFYSGIDPRLKYAQYKLSTSEFGYLGMFFSI